MMRQLLFALAVSPLVAMHTAHAQLAPQHASDLVTLRQSTTGEHCVNRTTGASEGFAMTNRVLSNGAIIPFAIPSGQVLVITDFQWGPTNVGPNAFEPVSLLLQGGEEAMTVSATGNNSPGANSTSANGLVGSNASIVGWVAVKPATLICVNGSIQPNPFAVVHGFLAPDQ
jgi:hypothetical protein